MIDDHDYLESSTKILIYDDVRRVKKQYFYEIKNFKRILNDWKKSQAIIFNKIDHVISTWKVKDNQLLIKFFCYHWIIIPYDVRMYVIASLPGLSEVEKETAILDIYQRSTSRIEEKVHILLTSKDNEFAKTFIKNFFLKYQNLIPEPLNFALQELRELEALKLQYQTLVLEKKLLGK